MTKFLIIRLFPAALEYYCGLDWGLIRHKLGALRAWDGIPAPACKCFLSPMTYPDYVPAEAVNVNTSHK